MSMSRKHFEDIARELREEVDTHSSDSERDLAIRASVRRTAHRLAAVFAADNSRFDKARFFEAAGCSGSLLNGLASAFEVVASGHVAESGEVVITESYDPFGPNISAGLKRHVRAWEAFDDLKRHCPQGTVGCVVETPTHAVCLSEAERERLAQHNRFVAEDAHLDDMGD